MPDLWEQIQGTVQKSVDESPYATWIRPLCFDVIELGTLKLSAPTRFIADWAKRNFLSPILMAARDADPSIKDVEISVKLAETKPQAIVPEMKRAEARAEAPARADEKYTFENFVESQSNALAVASLKRVIAEDKVSFNPLLIHSGSGFGKTHLLQAFAREMAERHPGRRLVYITADRFMYSFIKALKENDAVRFKESFKAADVLIVDDVHFLAGKESTARELYGIIDELIQNGRQVALASNASPFAIEGLNESLKSRISHGLIVDILPAEYSLRLEIVRRKSAAMELVLADGIAEFIASKIATSIRELEGAVNRISAHTILMGEAPTLSNIRKILADILAYNSKPIAIADIKKAVAEKWGVSVADLDSERKQRQFVIPRQVAMYVAKSLTSKSLPEIGRAFGGRNHATIIHACKKVRDMIELQPNIGHIIQEIEREFAAG